MKHVSTSKIFQNKSYFQRHPEQLVLEGYRHWAIGCLSGNTRHWNDVWDLYATILGSQDGRKALNALISFSKTIAGCAQCPLRMFQTGSQHICRDEALILCLISSIQLGDEATAGLCLSHLSCPTRCDEVAMEAANFALVLRTMEQTLLPIPNQVITDILARYEQSSVDWPGESFFSKTIH